VPDVHASRLSAPREISGSGTDLMIDVSLRKANG
jgi:hypothetical protein